MSRISMNNTKKPNNSRFLLCKKSRSFGRINNFKAKLTKTKSEIKLRFNKFRRTENIEKLKGDSEVSRITESFEDDSEIQSKENSDYSDEYTRIIGNI